MSSEGRLGVVELFAGAGGMAIGFQGAGSYDLIALNDVEASAQTTFKENNPNIEYLCNDVRDLTVNELWDAAAGRRVHGILGGPPCQGFSLAGRRKSDDDRNKLVGEYAKIVIAMQPHFLLMENVPQMLYHEQFGILSECLSKNYRVTATVLNAAQYGVPQTRHRAFILAYRRDLEVEPTFPAPTHDFVEREVFEYHAAEIFNPYEHPHRRRAILGADPATERRTHAKPPPVVSSQEEAKPLVNVWEALGDLSTHHGSRQYGSSPSSDYQTRLRRDANEPYNHHPRTHDSAMMNRIRAINEGRDLRAVDKSLHPKSHYSQAYGRLHRLGLARTVTTYFCNPGSGRFLHPVEDRALTVREAARLQGFPDTFKFFGTQSQQMSLVGNAVPPPLACVIAQHVRDTLQNAGVSGNL